MEHRLKAEVRLDIPDYQLIVREPLIRLNFDYKNNEIRFLNKYRFGGILADDMGLGKMLQALTLLKSTYTGKPSLVVCPRTLIYNWADEIEKFFRGTAYLVYHGIPDARETMRKSFGEKEVIIASYDTVSRDVDELAAWDFY